MRFFITILFLGILSINLNSKELININLENLKLDEFVLIVSKILNKNILISEPIEGFVNFSSSKKLSKDELQNILDISLREKGYFLKEENNFYKLAKLSDIEEKSLITKIINLKNVDGANLLKILEEIVNKRVFKEGSQKPIISFDNESNSLILMASSDEMDNLLSLINDLDVEQSQVYVQARIIELNDEMLENIGISYGIFGGKVGNHNLSTFSSSLNGGSNSTSVVKDILNLKIPDITSGLALGASLNLLKQNGALNIVSEPSILAINNKESSIYVGEKISVQTSSSVTDGGTQRTNFQREDVGLTLKVKPRISSDTKVVLEINTLLEGVKNKSVGAGENPDTLKKEIKTTAILNNGESVIIGGLIENKSEQIEQKIPVLGDIPLLGNAFKNDVNLGKKSNLVVIVTPYMIPKSKDITFVRNELAQLKNLEDIYLQDSLIRVKEEAIKKEQESKKASKKIKELDEKLMTIKQEVPKKDKRTAEDKAKEIFDSLNPN
ncbi:type II secretion system protein GspD [Arcobacter vandammei]|uniref:type II secretion system protein GspD n=1 Tax=Arcobacter vandammei TaxID=2782243 RepID=UPI0018DFDED1|nr:secretin N-terminal domain-containing protein [Arcobacter vandammei]